jgi:hypothetical protein
MPCTSTKRLSYLVEDNLILFQKTQRPYKPLIIKLLCVIAKALKQELTSMFYLICNLKELTLSTQEIAYFCGLLEDRHGEIRMKSSLLIHPYIKCIDECRKS